MFKKMYIALFVFMFAIALMQRAASATEKLNVKDYLNYITDSEKIELQKNIDSIGTDNNLEVVIVITNNTDGKSSKNFADDFYDNNGYGASSDHSGILMLINMEKRETWISTTGKAIDIFTDGRISDMTNNVTGELSKEEYYGACKIFIKDVKNYADIGIPQGQQGVESAKDNNIIDTEPTYFQKVFKLIKFFPIYIAALIISIIATILASLSSKGKSTINSQTYEGGSFVLSNAKDDFIREATTMVKIQNNPSSGSQSSTHTGSSGTTHGGGGGKF
ncbi:TPM domain-containing protein [Clostridium sp. CS001]|uniref:TPM domain-containing protein n=1 Tax=Clostridium sp. CS001 TaxID=2880648 RepID=UPI001CF3E7C7|nr:TPM domain-containing protein [Clostridium sp. CS001]MCB2289824.1 TPM domain-containing protein [Clostridium sp. CS001]